MKRIIYIVILLVILSCDKEGRPGHAGGFMEFTVLTPDMVSTRAEVQNDALQSEKNIYIYGAKSNGTSSENIVDAPGANLVYNENTKVWNPKVWVYEGYTSQEADLEWEEDYYYRFYGFAYSSNTNTSGNGSISITNDTYGRQFTVTQPADGDGSNTVDYLLSYLVNVNPNTYPLVPIQLEHAMARVDVDVQIANAMYDKDNDGNITGCLVKDISVTISDIRRGATMLCLQPKQQGEQGSHTWYVTFTQGLETATYTKEQIMNTEDNLEGTEGGISPDMSFIAVPVTNAEMTDYLLTLEYKDNNDTPYQYEFPLKGYSPLGWMNGHKVKYILTIDNSIHLTGKIVDYEDVDYIEAVIVPDIPGTK